MRAFIYLEKLENWDRNDRERKTNCRARIYPLGRIQDECGPKKASFNKDKETTERAGLRMQIR
jgi:hypothetical protein